jgi:hypothetical protein
MAVSALNASLAKRTSEFCNSHCTFLALRASAEVTFHLLGYKAKTYLFGSMWKLLDKALRVVATSFLVLLIGSLTLVVTMCDAGWHHSQDVVVRNQTSAPLLLSFTLPRSTLEMDTVWWGIAGKGQGAERAVGYALCLTELTAEDLRYHLPFRLSILLTATADTLVSFDMRTDLGRGNVPRRWDQEPWLTRQQQEAPSADDFARGSGLRVRAAGADSVFFTFVLAPDSSFLVARRSLGLRHSDPDRMEAEEFQLRPTVQWVNAAGTQIDRYIPVAAAQRQLEVAAQQERSNDYHLIHYLNYR